MKNIAIFGSTGSIGKNVIEVIKNDPKNFKVASLVANKDAKKLISQAIDLNPERVIIGDENKYKEVKDALKGLKIEVLAGNNSILEAAKIKCDLFISAIVGFAGMLPTLNAIKAGSNIALANKESLVCGGEFLCKEALKRKIKILPIDSEHNAIFQIFENENLDNIDDITLTASGGPFFKSDQDFAKITVEQALKHPNWSMGAKVTIDSATMMNKGLEMIEAYYLFPVKQDQIKILVHPQSIIHGMVSYNDGASLAMLSDPDMKIPISYALAYKNRMKIKHKKMDLAKLQNLEFFEVDKKRFPAPQICHDALKIAGSAPIVLNAANEVAVAKFLNNEIKFSEITNIVLKTLEKIDHKKLKSVEDIVFYDQKSREVAS